MALTEGAVGTMAEKLAFKARKTPNSPHPAAPPELPIHVESLYCAVDQDVLARATSAFRDSIVTSQILYKPGILAMARVIFEGTRWKLYHERDTARIIPFPGPSQMADWEQSQITRWDNANTRSDAQGIAFYVVDPSCDFSAKRFEELQEDFVRHLISNETLELDYNPNLKLHRKLDEEPEQFHNRCIEMLREKFSQEYQTLLDTLERQEDRLKEKLEREVREHGDPREAAAEERSSGLASNQQQMDTQGAIVDMDDIQRELLEIQKTRESKLKEFEDNLESLAQQLEKDILRVNHGNVKILRFALVWMPYTEFVIQENDTRRLEIIQSF